MSAWANLTISVFCSVLVAHVLRVAKQNKSNISAVLLVNYIIAFVIALLGAEFNGFSGTTIILGVITGAFFITNFYIFAESVHKNGLGISVVAMRLSLAVPILGSLFLFDEKLNRCGWLGLGLIILSLFLIQSFKTKDKNAEIPIHSGILMGLFLISGFGDFALKLFERNESANMNDSAFMSIVLGTAVILGIIKMKIDRANIGKKELFTGISLGIPNVFSSLYMIKALMLAQAVYIYPIANTSIISLGTILGVWYWKDKLSKKQWLGIGIAIIALITLVQGL